MAGRIIAAEPRRIEPRRHASVEKEGIPATEAVAGRKAPKGLRSVLGTRAVPGIFAEH